MKKFFGKKQVMIATLAVALGLAVYLNYYFAQQELPIQENNSTRATQHTGENLGDSQYVNGTTAATGDGQTDPTQAAEAPYFKQARESRQAAREESLEMLRELANDVTASQQVIDDTTGKIVAVAAAVDQESKIESLIKAKGFEDCVVFIEGENCNVVVQAEGLTAAQTLQITEIVTAQSPVKSENIKISAVKS